MDTLEDRLSSHKKKFFFKLLLIVLTLVVSFLYGFQHLLWLNDLNWDYKNAIFVTSIAQGWDVHHHIAIAKEIYERGYIPGNMYLAEYKDVKAPFWFPKVQYYLVAFMAKLLHLKVYQLIVIMDFILPPLIFLLAYWMLYTLSSVRSISMLGAFFLILTPYLFRMTYLPRVLKHFLSLQGLVPSILAHIHCYNCFSRSISPQLNYIFFLAALVFFFKGIVTAKYRFFVLSILFCIITSYSYPFFSTYLYTFLGTSAIISLILKDQLYFKRSLTILGVTLVFAAPLWLTILGFSKETLQGMTFMSSYRTPVINSQIWFTLLLSLIIIGLLIKHYVSKLTGLVSLSFMLSSIICLEQHVITGVSAPHTYLLYVIPEFTLLTIALLMAEWVKKQKQKSPSTFRQRATILPMDSLALYGGIALGGFSLVLSPSFVASHLSSDGILVPKVQVLLETLHVYGVVVGCILLISGIMLKWRFPHRYIRLATILYILAILYWTWDIGLTIYERYQAFIKPNFGYLQKLAPAVQWLNEHTKKESVIIGSLDYASTDSVIMLYTNNNVYVSMGVRWFTVPSLREFIDRSFNVMYLMGIRSQEDFKKTTGQLRSPATFEEYQEKLKGELYSQLKQYRADYLLYGPREKENFKVDPGKTYSFLKEVYHDKSVTIYRIM